MTATLDSMRATHGRPRGFIENWTPRAVTLALLGQIDAILDLYAKHLPLSARQVFYALVARYLYPKTERDYKNLIEVLGKARRARRISMDAIRDDGFRRTGFAGWQSMGQAVRYLQQEAATYRLNRQLGQTRRLVLWCEAEGMVPQLERVGADYSVPVYSSGGFDSITAKAQVAKEFAAMGAVTVLHVGDHDVSGVHIHLSLDEDVRAFMDEFGGSAEFVRLAVTPAQADALGLPTAPPKASDRRAFHGQTVQAEALPPDVLAGIVRDAITSRLDADIYGAVLEREAIERDRMVQMLGGVA